MSELHDIDDFDPCQWEPIGKEGPRRKFRQGWSPRYQRRRTQAAHLRNGIHRRRMKASVR